MGIPSPPHGAPARARGEVLGRGYERRMGWSHLGRPMLAVWPQAGSMTSGAPSCFLETNKSCLSRQVTGKGGGACGWGGAEGGRSDEGRGQCGISRHSGPALGFPVFGVCLSFALKGRFKARLQEFCPGPCFHGCCVWTLSLLPAATGPREPHWRPFPVRPGLWAGTVAQLCPGDTPLGARPTYTRSGAFPRWESASCRTGQVGRQLLTLL